jgi:NitT/TauT family transport system permease protein
MSASATLDEELAGLDQLEAHHEQHPRWHVRVWAATWPKLLAIAIVLTIWQFAYWREWKPTYVLPSPSAVWGVFWNDIRTVELWEAIANTMRRAVVGFTLALAIGGAVGLAMSRSRILRSALGSLVTGAQTMPSIAWFPFAILLFGLTDQSITFVVVLGAAPSIANGIIGGIDTVPPLFRRLGTSMGAGTVSLYRDFVVPAAMPSVVAGLKQGWAFSWRSLMAGELLVLIPGIPTLGGRLDFAREFSRADSMIATMIVILIVGILVDTLVFGRIERRVLARRGLSPH